MHQKRRFLLVAVVSLTVVVSCVAFLVDRLQKTSLEEEARDRIKMVLNFAQACEDAAKSELERAALEDTDRMMLEAMPTAVVARDIFSRFNREFEGYTYKQAVPGSSNPEKQADEFEAKIVEAFDATPDPEEITGLRDADELEQFYVARPIIAARMCLMCHGSAAAAPPAITKRFGTDYGTDWTQGEVVGALMVYVPTGHFRSHLASTRWTILGAFLALTVVLIGMTYCMFAKLINRSAELRRTRDQLQSLIDGIPSPLMAIDRNHKILLANRAATKSGGGIDPAAHGLTCYSVSHHRDTPCDGAGDPCPLQRAIEEKSVVTVSHVHYDSEGGKRMIDVTATPVFDEANEVCQVIECCYDVTERVRALEEIRLQSGALESAANAIAITDLSGRITWVNPAFTRLTGFPPEEAVGRNHGILKSGEQDEAFYRRLWTTITSGQVWHGELVNRRRDGSLYMAEMTITPLSDEEGDVSHFVAITQDVTARKQTEAHLEEATHAAEAANHAKSEFLANMSHEIRTPMTAILGFAESLLDTGLSVAERASAVDTIRRNGRHLLDVINDILDISKIEAGKMTAERIPCMLTQFVAEVKSLMQVRADEKGLQFRIQYVGKVPEVILTDPTRLRQILINVIGNAIKFTDTGSVRLILQFVDGDHPAIRFDVADTGIGMTPDQASGIFAPFTQADNSMARRYGGTGLGLTLSKRLAELLNGDIELADSQPGIGSRFSVTVATGPLEGVEMVDAVESAARAGIDRSPEPPEPPDRLGCRILLAEDGPDNQRIISFVLKKAGAEVVVTENGRLAVDATLAARNAGSPFDLILMDMQMPVMGGYQATALLRKEGYDGPIIALTAHAMTEDRQKCLDAGCDDYASKPIDRGALIGIVSRHVDSKRHQKPAAAAAGRQSPDA